MSGLIELDPCWVELTWARFKLSRDGLKFKQVKLDSPWVESNEVDVIESKVKQILS